jgi:hypothetical protein
MHDIDRTLERFHHLAIAPSEFAESVCSLLQNSSDGLYGATGFELRSEGMVSQFSPRQFFILLQGSLEEQSEVRGTRWVTHCESKKYQLRKGDIPL